jgi:hypothetical protein
MNENGMNEWISSAGLSDDIRELAEQMQFTDGHIILQLYFHFVIFCGIVSNNMLFGAKGVIISPAGERAPDVIRPAASLQPGERLGYGPQQGLRFLRVC